MWNIWGMFPALAIAPCCYDISLYYHGHFHLVLSSLQGQGPGSGSIWQNLCYIMCNLTDSFFPDCESFTFTLRKPFYQIFRQVTKARLKHPYLGPLEHSFKGKFSSNLIEFKFHHARVNQVVCDKPMLTCQLPSFRLCSLITFGCYYNRKQTHWKQRAVLPEVPNPLSYGKGIT